MPYCPKCGTNVGAADVFCAKCGGRQPGFSGAATAQAHPGMGGEFMGNLSNRHAALLCYIPLVGWIAAIVVLAADRYRRDTQVRFHAFQGLYLFVAWLIVDWVIKPIHYMSYDSGMSHLVTGGLQLLGLFAWIFMMVKVSQDQMYKLPIVGELAEKSVSEQCS